MNRFARISIAVFTLIVAGQAPAQNRVENGCFTDSFGKTICAPPNGELYRNYMGQFACGLGQCVKDAWNEGQILCSSQPGGYATKEPLSGKITCTGGCEPVSISNCQVPR